MALPRNLKVTMCTVHHPDLLHAEACSPPTRSDNLDQPFSFEHVLDLISYRYVANPRSHVVSLHLPGRCGDDVTAEDLLPGGRYERLDDRGDAHFHVHIDPKQGEALTQITRRRYDDPQLRAKQTDGVADTIDQNTSDTDQSRTEALEVAGDIERLTVNDSELSAPAAVGSPSNPGVTSTTIHTSAARSVEGIEPTGLNTRPRPTTPPPGRRQGPSSPLSPLSDAVDSLAEFLCKASGDEKSPQYASYYIRLGVEQVSEEEEGQPGPIDRTWVVVAEVGPGPSYRYWSVSTWNINGVDIAGYSNAAELADLATPAGYNAHNITPDPYFEQLLASTDLENILLALRLGGIVKAEVPPGLVAAPEKVIDSIVPLQAPPTAPPELERCTIDCVVEYINRTTESDLGTFINVQQAAQMDEDFSSMRDGIVGEDCTLGTIQDMLSQKGYRLELWVLPQSERHTVHRWEPGSGLRMRDFLRPDVWKLHRSLYIEARVIEAEEECGGK